MPDQAPTSDIGMMYRNLLQQRGVPMTADNMQRVVQESRRTPGLIPGLTLQQDDAPPNVAAAGTQPNAPGALNSGVTPPVAAPQQSPLPIPPIPPQPSVDQLPLGSMPPGVTSPGGVIPGTGATPSPDMGAGIGTPTPAPGGASLAQMILGGVSALGAGLFGNKMLGPSGGGAEYMGNAGQPFTPNPDRGVPVTQPQPAQSGELPQSQGVQSPRVAGAIESNASNLAKRIAQVRGISRGIRLP